MAKSSSADRSEAGGTQDRRSTRIQISIPVTIAGTDTAGRDFKEGTRTIIINKHGGKISTSHQLSLGSELTIENRRLGRTARASVVWIGERKSVKDPGQIGIQLFEAQNIWGIDFTPEDWQELQAGRVSFKSATLLRDAGIVEAPDGETAKSASPGMETANNVSSASPVAESADEPAAPSTTSASLNAGADKGMDASAEARLKDFEGRLRAIAARMGGEAETAVQQAAKEVENRLASSAEARLRSVLEKLDAAHHQIDHLLAAGEDVRNAARQEIEKARSEMEVAKSRVLEVAQKELNEKISPVLERAGQEVSARIQRKVEQAAENASEAWGHKAADRLLKMTEEHLAKAVASFDARGTEALKETESRFRTLANTTAAEWHSRLEKDAQQAAAAVQAELTQTLRETGERLIGEVAQTFEGRAKAALGDIEETLRGPLQKIREQILSEIDGADLRARKYCDQEAERAERKVADHISARVDKAKEALDQATEQLRSRAQEATERALQDFRSQELAVSEAVMEGLKGRASDLLNGAVVQAARRLEAESAKTLASQLGAAQEEFLQSATQSLAEKMKVSQKNMIEEARKYLVALGKTTVESLNKEVVVGLDHYRGELRRMAQEDVAATAERLKQERAAALSEAQELFRNSIAQMFSSFGAGAKQEKH